MAGDQVRNCDFCRIASGEDDSAEIVAAAEDWIAFFPQNPATRGHTLVIPRMHVRDLWECGPSLSCALTGAVIAVGKAISAALTPDGLNSITSAGEAAEQSVFHLHLHVVPRWYEDGFGHIWPQGARNDPRDLIDTARRIRRSYEYGL
jgi:histidine triad (HIT) family protein